MNHDKFALNLQILKDTIPKKPECYTKDYPKNLKESLLKYCNTRTVNGIQMSANTFNQNNWPLILWFDPDDVKVGFFNKLYYRRFYNSWKFKKKLAGFKSFGFLTVMSINTIALKRNLDDCIIEAFDANLKYVQKKLMSNSLLSKKTHIILELFQTFRKGYWIGTVCIILPLIDFIARKLLKTNNLKRDIGAILKLFNSIGFTINNVDDLMPHMTGVMSYDPEKKLTMEERNIIWERVKDNNFGLIGPFLSSFLRFANYYYEYYIEDNNDCNVLNRHAILHGSINNFGNKINAIKLITFLFLFLELEPVFEILLKDE